MPAETRPVPFTLGSSGSRTLELEHFGVAHAWFPPGSVLPRHSHERAGIAVMLHGSFDLDLTGRSFSCTPGTLVTEPAGERHANRVGSAGAEVIVLQSGTDAGALFGATTRLFDGIDHRAEFGLSVLAARMLPELQRPDAFSDLVLESLAMQLLVGTARSRAGMHRGRAPRWLHRVRDYLQAADAKPPRTTELAAIAEVDPLSLDRAFRRHFGITLGAYARHLRLERCARQLVESDSPVALIASRAGFADQSHFIRMFRRHFGITPGAFRRRCHADAGRFAAK